ncbi:Chondroitin sulfate synthase 2 [Papilio xuthus]|uniref:Hexosyltransferase n=1 Tax=Papilio xuthus TaxID=66420 RepID=A0A0N1IQK7_PAPXU|nr:Chondroitin sulfate synthase 2 [Papilio xuthus]
MLSRCVVSQVKHNSYFLVGLALGLWLALATVPLEDDVTPAACNAAGPPPVVDEWEPVREQREMGAAGAAGRSVQRPRYYSTELGMRAGLLAGALSSEAALAGRAAALNRTAARLLPALRFFITASALRSAPAGANVVGFTDTREMLKPFHALKYLADNYLEEYDFFFLVTDATYVNAQRLTELVSKLSVSQDVYMGTVADDDTQYCTLESGILLSNSVLRAVHGALDWCVRNSYSPHHHENIGRCVLHAAHTTCTSSLQVSSRFTLTALSTPGYCTARVILQDIVVRVQGESYVSWRVGGAVPSAELEPALADAVTAHPVHDPHHMYQLHAYVLLQRAQAEVARLRVQAAASARRHPRGFRNATWPPGLRNSPGLAPPPPNNRFDHLRWTTFNATHALMPDDHRTAAPLAAATKQAIQWRRVCVCMCEQLALAEAGAWARRRWAAGGVRLLEGAWCWEPPHALRYRLLLALRPDPPQVHRAPPTSYLPPPHSHRASPR